MNTLDKRFWSIYFCLKNKYPLWSNKKLVYITHKFMNKKGD